MPVGPPAKDRRKRATDCSAGQAGLKAGCRQDWRPHVRGPTLALARKCEVTLAPRSCGGPAPRCPNGIPVVAAGFCPRLESTLIWLRFGFVLASFCNSSPFSSNRAWAPLGSPTSRLDTATPREYIQLSKNQLLCPFAVLSYTAASAVFGSDFDHDDENTSTLIRSRM